jgi:hypothetical protein
MGVHAASKEGNCCCVHISPISECELEHTFFFIGRACQRRLTKCRKRDLDCRFVGALCGRTRAARAHTRKKQCLKLPASSGVSGITLSGNCRLFCVVEEFLRRDAQCRAHRASLGVDGRGAPRERGSTRTTQRICPNVKTLFRVVEEFLRRDAQCSPGRARSHACRATFLAFAHIALHGFFRRAFFVGVVFAAGLWA